MVKATTSPSGPEGVAMAYFPICDDAANLVSLFSAKIRSHGGLTKRFASGGLHLQERSELGIRSEEVIAGQVLDEVFECLESAVLEHRLQRIEVRVVGNESVGQ